MPTETPTCEMCVLPATAMIQYGTDEGIMHRGSMHKTQLCDSHRMELWGRCNAAVSAGMMAWTMETPK